MEQEIAEQISFFHLNTPSSSIVVKVDFDLTLSLLAHNLFRVLSSAIPGFERCTVDTISRKFLENGAKIKIDDNVVTVHLKKKTHIPLLLDLPWMKVDHTNFLDGCENKICVGNCLLRGTISIVMKIGDDQELDF